MMLLFMNMQRGDMVVLDHEGQDFESLDQARAYAIGAAREIMSETIRLGRGPDDARFNITDASGQVVLIVPFSEALDKH